MMNFGSKFRLQCGLAGLNSLKLNKRTYSMTAWVAQVNDCLTGISKSRNSIGEDYTAWKFNHVRRIINGLIQRVVFVRLVPIYIATCVVPHTSGGIIYSSKKSNTSKERNCNFLLKKPLQGIVVRITPPVGVVEPSPGRYRFFDSRDHKTPGYACYLKWSRRSLVDGLIFYSA